MDPNNLPGNSQTVPTAQEPRQHRQAVVNAKIVPEGKKSFGQKMKEAFAPPQGQPDFGESVLKNVVAPAVKGTIFAAIVGGVSALLYGATGNRGFGGYGYGGYGLPVNPFAWTQPRYGAPLQNFTDYSGIARPAQNPQQNLPKAGPTKPTDIYFQTRAEAELVKDSLAEILVTYHQVTLLDFFETCGVQGNSYTDAYVGWTDLSQLRVKEGYGGWMISLPNPRPLGR